MRIPRRLFKPPRACAYLKVARGNVFGKIFHFRGSSENGWEHHQTGGPSHALTEPCAGSSLPGSYSRPGHSSRDLLFHCISASELLVLFHYEAPGIARTTLLFTLKKPGGITSRHRASRNHDETASLKGPCWAPRPARSSCTLAGWE